MLIEACIIKLNLLLLVSANSTKLQSNYLLSHSEKKKKKILSHLQTNLRLGLCLYSGQLERQVSWRKFQEIQ